MKERILNVLKIYAEAEINLASAAGRELLANALIEVVMYSKMELLTKEEQTMVDQKSDPE